MEKKIIILSVAFLLFAIAPGATFAQQFIARLTTTGNQSITVNNASASSGATILTGSTIETPAAAQATINLGSLGKVDAAPVQATINLGSLGKVDAKPDSKFELNFSDDGNLRVKLLRGCVAIKKKGPGEAEIFTAAGASEKTNSKRRGIGFCSTSTGMLTTAK